MATIILGKLLVRNFFLIKNLKKLGFYYFFIAKDFADVLAAERAVAFALTKK